MTNIFEGIKKVHLIGIGGIGMSGIAEYLARKNFEVTGSDVSAGSVTQRLKKFNVRIFKGHDENNLSEDTELVIYTSAVKDGNEELMKAKRLGINLIKRARALGSIVNDKFVISVAGTHGKTTTTAMIAKVLIENKVDPTVFVGGNIDFLDGGSSRIGNGKIAVVEADEYDRSFLELNSDMILITNIDADHFDIYKNIGDIRDNFKKFAEKSKPGAKIIACGDDPNVCEVLEKFENCTLYGFKKSNDCVITDVNYGKKCVFFKINKEDIRIRVPGSHNILNSTAAYTVTREFDINAERFNEAMATFSGVKRRLELKFDNGIKIYDDYAHHPTEVTATLDAIKRLRPSRVIAVFQPHLFSRTRDFHKEFGKAFTAADMLFLAKIYPAREKEIEGVSSELILNEYLKSGKEGTYIEDTEEMLDEIENIAREGDTIIFLGAGDITEICDKFVKRIKAKSNWTVPL